MAVLTPSTATIVWSSPAGPGSQTILFRVPGVNTGDTIDLATWFKKVLKGAFICNGEFSGANGAAVVTIASNTNCTLTLAGVALHDLMVLVEGSPLT